MRATRIVLLAAGLAGPVAGQYAFTLNYQLDDYQQVAGAESSYSQANAAFAQLDVAGGVGLASASYSAEVGFLAMHDPGATKAPLIFSLTPEYGFMDEDTALTVGGMNFVQGGNAGSVSLEVGGLLVGDLSVVSDTQLTGTVLASSSGPKDVKVTSEIGSETRDDGFVHTPGLWLPEALDVGTVLTMKNYGPIGASFDVWVSPNQTFIPLPPFGVIEIGPAPIFSVLSGVTYPAPDGVHTVASLVPDNPTLVGVKLHFQTVAVLSIVPLDVRLTNSRTVVYE